MSAEGARRHRADGRGRQRSVVRTVSPRGSGERSTMSVDEIRERNQRKAEAEAERGPVREDPATTPIGDAIHAFHTRGDLAFGIPAHRSGTGDVRPDAAEWAGEQAFKADVGMNNGVDNRHQSWHVEPTAMERFAQAVGADQTLFSTNGSSENVHVAMMPAVQPRETLVMARNGHKFAFAGLVLSGRSRCTSIRSTTQFGRLRTASIRASSSGCSTRILRPSAV